MAIALGCLLLFSVLAFASTQQWALSTLQAGIFAGGIWCAIRRRLRWHPLGFPLVGIVACGVLQLLTNSTVYRFATGRALLGWAAYTVLFLVALQALDRAEVRQKFLRGTLYAGAAIAVLSTVQYFTSGGAIYWIFPVRAGRPFGPFVNPDHYAAFVELILPLAIYEIRRDRGREWLYMAMAAVFYGSVIASASRAGAILVTIEVLALPLLGRPARTAAKIIAMFVILSALASAVVGCDVLWKRFQDSDPFRYRREIFVSTLQMIRQRPWTGSGLGTFATVYPEFASFDVGLTVDHAHNDWAEWTAEGGVPMLLLMLAFAAGTVRPALRSGWGLGVHAVLLHSLVDFPLQIPAITALVITFAAALCYNLTPKAKPG